MPKESWVFDPDNYGNSFYSGYGITNEQGKSEGIFIETGREFDDEEQRKKAALVASAPQMRDAMIELIAAISKRFSNDPDQALRFMNDDLRGKVEWAMDIVDKSYGEGAHEPRKT